MTAAQMSLSLSALAAMPAADGALAAEHHCAGGEIEPAMLAALGDHLEFIRVGSIFAAEPRDGALKPLPSCLVREAEPVADLPLGFAVDRGAHDQVGVRSHELDEASARRVPMARIRSAERHISFAIGVPQKPVIPSSSG